MQVAFLDTARIDREWEAIEASLQPALAEDPDFDLTDLYGRLLDGTALIFEVGDGANGLWVVSIGEDDGLVAWTTAIAGKIEGGPKQRLATMRHAVRALENTLKQAGVRAHRICGRDWSAILPDYAPYAGARNGLEKRL
jgi:hypothetical protein